MIANASVAKMNSQRVLVIDDDPFICRFITNVVRSLGYEVETAQTAEDFLQLVKSFNPTYIISDLVMPDKDGVELLKAVAKMGSEANILLISGMDNKVLRTALKVGKSLHLNMLGVLQKPVSIEDLEDALTLNLPSAVHTLSVSRFQQALDDDELILVYQPKYARNDDGLWVASGAEALIRWQHPKKGLLGAGTVVELTTQGELFMELLERVMTIACRQLANWKQQGIAIPVSVNLSPQLLDNPDLPDQLQQICQQYEVNPSELTLEVTESAAMTNPQQALEILTRCRFKGFNLSIDDFGTGFSSLKQLYQVPFTELKIDRIFVEDITSSDEARTIVEISTMLAKRLGLKVCIEGVETAEQLKVLEELGCDTIQGFYFSPPIEHNQTRSLLLSSQPPD